jgi:hypothetical protein
MPEVEKIEAARAPAAEKPATAKPAPAATPARSRQPRKPAPAPEPAADERESAEDVPEVEGEVVTADDDDFAEDTQASSSVEADSAKYSKSSFREIMEDLIKQRGFKTAAACLDVCTAIHDHVDVLANIPLEGTNNLKERVERAFVALKKMG